MIPAIHRLLLFGAFVALVVPRFAGHAEAAAPQQSNRIAPPHFQGSPPPPGACGVRSCARALLKILNTQRADAGLAPLRLIRLQSRGTAGCAGSMGHSAAMASSGSIWHSDMRYPRASFPHDMCERYMHAGENVGEATTGSVLEDLRTLHQQMMSEPHSIAACASMVSHACNILDPAYSYIGIGIDVAGGTTWLTEDFAG